MCIQETKLSLIYNSLTNEILGARFDYDFVPAINVSGGVLLGWHVNTWVVTNVMKGRFSLSDKVSKNGPVADPWWITVIYGLQ